MDEHEIELRRLRLEAREQLEDAEAAAHELAVSLRTMRDVLLDEGRQAHVVKVDVANLEIVGRVEHVGDSVVRLCGADGRRTTIALDAVDGVRVVREESRAVLVSVGYPATIEARLREWVQVQAMIEVGRRNVAGTLLGRLRAVTPTHIELAPTATVGQFVPLAALAWVRRVEG